VTVCDVHCTHDEYARRISERGVRIRQAQAAAATPRVHVHNGRVLTDAQLAAVYSSPSRPCDADDPCCLNFLCNQHCSEEEWARRRPFVDTGDSDANRLVNGPNDEVDDVPF